MKKGSRQETLLPFLSIDPVTALASLNVELGNNAELSLTSGPLHGLLPLPT